MTRVVDKRRDGTRKSAAEVVTRSAPDGQLPEPFGLLAGRLPEISIDDIKRARRVALSGDKLA